MLRAICLSATLCLPLPALAQDFDARAVAGFDTAAPELFDLLDATGIYEILAIMSGEIRASAAQYEADLFPGRGGFTWQAAVDGIYSADSLIGAFEDAFDESALSGAELADLMAFYSGDTGRRIVSAELVARAAIADPDILEAAEANYALAREDGDPRLDILERFNAAGSLVEHNLAGGLNANVAFLTGLADGEAIPLSEADILAQVASQEPEVRAETETWLYSYQLMAYAGLDDADLEAYVRQSDSAAGNAFTAVLFGAFNRAFAGLQYRLGRAAAEVMTGQDI